MGKKSEPFYLTGKTYWLGIYAQVKPIETKKWPICMERKNMIIQLYATNIMVLPESEVGSDAAFIL